MGTTDHPLTPLGELFTQALERSGLSQNKLAARVVMSVSSWNNIVYGGRELGGKFVTVETTKPGLIARIAFALGVNIEEALKLRGYTLNDVPRIIRYDLSHVPIKQLQAELRRRAKGTSADVELTDQYAEEFEAALDAVERGQPQPPASPEWRHAGAEKATGA